jgi:transposase InsO family protein
MCNFYWPGMSYFIRSYVQGCATCQANKIDNHPPCVATMPNAVPKRPFQVMTTDFITDLPECKGFTAIAVYVDRGYKMVYITPTVKTVNSVGASDLFMCTVFPHTGVMEQLISDRGPQFASKTAQHKYKMLGIKSSMSTAYHPQTDGQTEQFNWELKQYLRIFCNYRQDDWVRLLPIAQFAHNSQIFTTTEKSPFQLLYGFNPRSYPTAMQASSWPAINDCLRDLHTARDKAQSALHLAADATTMRDGKLNTNSETYKVADKIWLDGKNLKTTQPKAKLSPRRFGPFEVTSVLGPVTYGLAIPPRWQNAHIHPVFDASLLLRYHDTATYGPNFPEPPPDVTNIEDNANNRFEVEAILNGRPTRNKRGFQYLVKWLGYSGIENQWLPQSALNSAWEAITEYHNANNAAPKPTNYTKWLKARNDQTPEESP